MTNLEKEFKARVVEHMTMSLSPSDWARFRAMSRSNKPMDQGLGPAHELGAEELADAAMTIGAQSLAESIAPWVAEAVEVSYMTGRPVIYIPSQGIYAWEAELDRTFSISLASPA